MSNSTSFRLSQSARAALKRLAAKSGLSETQVLEILLAQAESLKIVVQWGFAQVAP